MLTYATDAEGLSALDFAAYRVLREKGYPPEAAPGVIGDGLRTGEIGLIIPSIGRGDFEVLGVCSFLFLPLFALRLFGFFSSSTPSCPDLNE